MFLVHRDRQGPVEIPQLHRRQGRLGYRLPAHRPLRQVGGLAALSAAQGLDRQEQFQYDGYRGDQGGNWP